MVPLKNRNGWFGKTKEMSHIECMTSPYRSV